MNRLCSPGRLRPGLREAQCSEPGNVSDVCEAERQPRLGSMPAALVASLLGADEGVRPYTIDVENR